MVRITAVNKDSPNASSYPNRLSPPQITSRERMKSLMVAEVFPILGKIIKSPRKYEINTRAIPSNVECTKETSLNTDKIIHTNGRVKMAFLSRA